MNESLLAGRYAKALLAYAIEVGEEDALYPILRGLGRTLRCDQRVKGVVDNPTFSEELRERFVVALSGEEPPQSLVRFVDLVFRHDREMLLGEMARAYMRLYRRHKGIVYARLVAVSTPDEATIERLREIIRQRFGGEVELDVMIDKELLGGFVLRVEGRVLDASARGAIERIRQQFVSRNRSIV